MNAISITKNSARSQALELISQLIFSGKLQPDKRINETSLAREFGVSQTPIREALLSLEGKGFLMSQPDKGFYVRPLDLQEVRDLYPVLAQLESLAFGLITHFPASRLKQMRQINSSFANVTGEDAVRLDEAWHAELLAECRNNYLLKTISRVRADMQRYETLFFLEGGNPKASAEEHEEITAMIEVNALSDAAQALRSNCLSTIDEICGWLEQRT